MLIILSSRFEEISLSYNGGKARPANPLPMRPLEAALPSALSSLIRLHHLAPPVRRGRQLRQRMRLGLPP